jgi:hypothetical protein
MSPDRFAAIQTPDLSPKPYERTDPLVHADDGQDTVDRAGFPTYAQYKAFETVYLDSLSSQRRAKALIPQALFDRIWDVLIAAKCDETAQFRFWARRMFKLTILAEVDPDGELGEPTRQVVVHDGLLVAVKERMYTILCYFHERTGHAGRDKTCASIRRYYTWVPKDLVALFVKTCPTCKSKRRGRLGSFMLGFTTSAPPSPTQLMLHNSGTSSEPPAAVAPSDPKPDVSIVGKSCVTTCPHDSLLVMVTEGNFGARPLDMNTERQSISQTSAAPPTTTPGDPQNMLTGLGLRSLPMSREVSLYQGLPNGWQFYSDYATARTACIEVKKWQLSHPGRPRIPSVAPMTVPPTVEDLLAFYSTSSGQERDQEEQCSGYINPALLWTPRTLEETSTHNDGKQTSDMGRSSAPPQLHLDLSGNSETFRSLYALAELDSNAFCSSGGSPHSLTPELVESMVDKDSPFVTELSTPQDESINELGDSVIYDEVKYIPIQNSTPTGDSLTSAVAH